jgi:hypothetical protein
VLDSVSDDTEVGDELSDSGSSLGSMPVLWVIVSVLGHVTKRLYALGWVFQASVEEFRMFKNLRARCGHDAELTRRTQEAQ